MGFNDYKVVGYLKDGLRYSLVPLGNFGVFRAQKGTVGLTIKQSDMPFSPETGMSPDLIMNPNAIPSRMTLGQFLETVTGKLSALKGIEFDGTPFQKFDLDKIRKELANMGYRDDGTEELYSGMTGKPMRRRIFIGPTYYMRLKHLVLDKIHCLTMDHEVLTENGWKFFKDINKKEKVATIIDGKLSYEKPKKLLYFPNHEGEMYHIKNQQIDLNVTSNHRMYVSTCRTRQRVWSDYELIEAKKIYGKTRKYLKNATWEQKDYQFILPSITDKNNILREEKVVDMDAWLTFFGIWIAEGWATYTRDKRYVDTGHYQVTICQCKERVQAVITDALTKLGYNYQITSDNSKISVYDKQLFTYMKKYSVGAPNKFLPDWVWKLSQEQTRKLINSMVLGDGSILQRTHSENNACYYTSSVKLANDFQRLCLHAGWSANISLHHKKGNVNYIEGRKITSNYDLWRLGIIKQKNSPCVNHGHTSTQNIQVEEIYNAKCDVFCLEMPHETFYVRRNGKPVWTGNSRSRGPRTLLTHQAP